ncbi:hypothetical protein BG011_005015 [Mortierella polycephala]|uniref:Alpha/beta hydrolase fold-3 domain-containing protein n=1 Tax=Mortierella polycephala TaxID=41804 RepID=A0A9P6QGC6_9FUNG|nr:hypothetical protein BG011_005015 [Mortierella polycephala]
MVALNIKVDVADVSAETAAFMPSSPIATSPSSHLHQQPYKCPVDQQPLLSHHTCDYNASPISSSSSPKSRSSFFSRLIQGIVKLFSSLWMVLTVCYNCVSAWLLPNEPEPLDLDSTLFFLAQIPFLALVALIWIPSFLVWLLGIRGSQAGGQGQGQGMRKTWSARLALALSFLKVYLRQAEYLTIEECQGRSRSIPFMTAPAGTRVKKVKIAAYPWRSKAEAIVLERLTVEEKELLHLGKQRSQGGRTKDHQLDGANMEWSDRTGSHHYNHHQEDVFAEGLDAEWLEHTGPEVFADENAAAVLYFHGGGYYSGSKEEHRVLIGPLVKRLGRNIRILTDQSVSEAFSLGTAHDGSMDMDECFKPEQIIFMGDSAGGGLVLSLCLLLRDHGLAQPRSVVTWSPWLDLTQSLPSFQENAATDCIPYEDFTHRHSDAVDMMFRHQESDEENHRLSTTKPKVRQRAQVYCPDSYVWVGREVCK